MSYTSCHPNYYETRPLVMKAFRVLRKLGFVAKPNFSCCGTCASHEAFAIAKESGKTVVAWWHHQDEDHYRKRGTLYIGFGHVKDVDDSTTELGDQVGRLVAKALVDVGLKVEWGGDSGQRIMVVGKE